MPGVAHDSRKNSYKNAGRSEENRRRRTEGSLELRKQKKDENLMKRRNLMAIEDESSESDSNAAAALASADGHQPVKKGSLPEMTLEDCQAVLCRMDEITEEKDQIEGAIENVRRKLSRSNRPPIKEVINLGLVPVMLRLIQQPISEKSHFEATWAITNIVSGTSDETRTVVDAGGIVPLIQSLNSVNADIGVQAAWALGNIAGDCGELRNAVIESGIVEPMLKMAMQPNLTIEVMRNLAWVFSNLCRHKTPPPPLDTLTNLMPYLARMLCHPDREVATDTCWALSYLTDGPDQQIEVALASGVLPRVVDMLKSGDKHYMAPALRTLGNMVTGSDKHTQAVVDTGILNDAVPALLSNPVGANITKECVWMLSNILAGIPSQIQAVLESPAMPHIIRLLDEGDHKVRHEAAWAVVNLSTGSNLEQAMAFVQMGGIQSMCSILNVKDGKIITLLLEGLDNYLSKARSLGRIHEEKLAEIIEESDGLDKLEELQQHEDTQIYNLALKIIETYFQDDEDDDNNAQENDKAVPNAAEPKAGGYEF